MEQKYSFMTTTLRGPVNIQKNMFQKTYNADKFIGNLRQVMRDNSITQKELADAIGVTTVTVSSWFSDNKPTWVDYVFGMLEFLSEKVPYFQGIDLFEIKKVSSDKYAKEYIDLKTKQLKVKEDAIEDLLKRNTDKTIKNLNNYDKIVKNCNACGISDSELPDLIGKLADTKKTISSYEKTINVNDYDSLSTNDEIFEGVKAVNDYLNDNLSEEEAKNKLFDAVQKFLYDQSILRSED